MLMTWVIYKRCLDLDDLMPEYTIKSKKEKKEEYEQANAMIQETCQRKWMEKHGKGKFVQFNDE